MATTAKKDATLKLLIDNNTKKVVFAEAGKDFVDFLFGLLQVPVGTIMRNLWEQRKDGPGSLGTVYESVVDLDSGYFLTNANKHSLVCPKMPSSSNVTTSPLLQEFECKKGNCNSMYNPYGSSATPIKEEGFVRGMTQYMVMDNLKVKPMSTLSCITLLNTCGIRDIGSLVEKNVVINFEKGLELVKTSFVSETVLTDVFVRKIQRTL